MSDRANEEWDVFVSHSGYAEGWVQKLAKDAREVFKLRVFVDKDDIDYGENIPKRIGYGLKNSRDVVLAINAEAVASEWVAREISAKICDQITSKKGRIIPVRLDDTPLEDFDFLLKSICSVDLTDDNKAGDVYWRFLASLAERRVPDPHFLVVHSPHDVNLLDLDAFVSAIKKRNPGAIIRIVDICPTNSSEIRLITDGQVSDYLKQIGTDDSFPGVPFSQIEVHKPLLPSHGDYEFSGKIALTTNTEFPESFKGSQVDDQKHYSDTDSLAERIESIRRRANQSFVDRTPSQVLESRRAIIGPRTDQLEEDAEDARRLFIEGKEPSPRQLAALEYAIRLLRPSPKCNPNGLTKLSNNEHPFGIVWDGFRDRLQEIQVSVARLDRVEDPNAIGESGRTPLGTGFIVGEGILLTAAHVVEQLSYGTRLLESGQAIAEFFGYYGATGREPCSIEKVVAFDADIDLALLQFKSSEFGTGRPILKPRAVDLEFGKPIAVVGYPLEDPRNRAALISIIFGEIFAVKRAAIGGVIAFGTHHFLHDCSTLGGNSGSPVFDLQTGEVCGVHVSGAELVKNQAVRGATAAKFIQSHLAPSFPLSTISQPRKSAKMSTRPDFGKYLEQLKESDPEIVTEFDTALHERAMQESAHGDGFEMTPEAIVLTTGRPVLDVKRGAAVLAINEIQSQVWKNRLTNASALLAENIPAVGRIEIANHPRGIDWLGSGWLLRDNIVVTNRHVAEIFGHSGGNGFLFRPGYDGTKMSVAIDFLEEFDSHASHEFPLFKILHIEKGGGPDLAFLRIEPVSGQELPQPARLASQPAVNGDQIAVIGYPARDPFFPNRR